ncbi:ras guanine nucleotide exchange factor domain-containing protein [Choanephora cucurbitarum]|nr:ras guanine nucleotide exchange factor domain-containing protein [Choanephora cucurbitarum]
MNKADVICRVRALYSYRSTESSSLSFHADSIIDVLCQLDSGWWDGWCDGRRGWFPSNYVEVIPESEAPWSPLDPPKRTQRTLIQTEAKKQLRLSLHAADTNLANFEVGANCAPSLEDSPWVLQITEDGSEQYYYNRHTHEMSHSPPAELTMHNESHLSFNDGTFFQQQQQQQQQYHFSPHRSAPPVRPVRAPNRITTDELTPSNRHTNLPIMLEEDYEDDFQDKDDKLPPNWVRKVTSKGQFFYYNIKTEESTFELENIDPDTGRLILNDLSMPGNGSLPTLDTSSSHSGRSSSPLTEPILETQKEPLTWHSLDDMISQAVESLRHTIQQNQLDYITQDATVIVHRVRLLLYVTHCIEKESSMYLRSHKSLRSMHRALMAVLAKMVLSTKVASSAWPTADQLHKLDLDTTEVLISVRHFISTAQDLQVVIRKSIPTFKSDANDIWRNNPLVVQNPLGETIGHQDMMDHCLSLADHVRNAIDSYQGGFQCALQPFERNHHLQGTLDKLRLNAPLHVAQFRNLSNATSEFLNGLEEVCQAQPHHVRTLALVKAKQPIYQAMGGLFVVAQTVASTDLDAYQIKTSKERLEACIQAIRDGLDNVIQTVRDISPDELVHESHPIRHGSVDSIPTIITPQQEEGVEQEDEASLFKTESDLPLANPPSEKSPTAHQQKDKMAKLAGFFGEDALGPNRLNRLPSMTSFSSQGVEPDWFLKSDYHPDEIAFNMEGNVKGGTLHSLVQYMTQHDQLDSNFNSTFLLTYRSFCTTEELFEELFQRYQLPAPEGLSPEELERWKEKKLKLVRLRVFNIIKSWLETYFNEEEDRPILISIDRFTETAIADTMKFGAEQLTKLIKKRMMAEESGQIRKMKLNFRTGDMPVPILPKNMKHIKLLEVDPLELARQLTVMDFKLYNRIKPVECLDKNWGKADLGDYIAVNIRASIEHSNQVTAWVTDSILSKDNIKKRATVMKHWILVAERCRSLQNFNTCMAILSAFDNGSIGRLKRTWELMSTRTMATLQNIRKLMGANRNFSEYRELIKKINPPCIPFLGIYLQDLTFIDDGNSNLLKKSNNLINFSKRMKTAEVIRDLQQYQSTHYMLSAVPDLQEFIKTHLHSSREDEELYSLSLKLEPRERGEDTIARRLKESGL